MSLKSFDEAILSKVKEVFPNVSMAYEDKYEDMGDEKKDLLFPLINIWRMSNIIQDGMYNTHKMMRQGFKYPEKDGKFLDIRSLPVTVNYQVDIMSDLRVQVDDIFKELAMFFIIQNSLHVSFDMGPNVEPICREFTIKILDNQTLTEYSSFGDRGRIYREVINLEIPNAELLFAVNKPMIKEIKLHTFTQMPIVTHQLGNKEGF